MDRIGLHGSIDSRRRGNPERSACDDALVQASDHGREAQAGRAPRAIACVIPIRSAPPSVATGPGSLPKNRTSASGPHFRVRHARQNFPRPTVERGDTWIGKDSYLHRASGVYF
jgi:hypothetical protein